MTSSATYRSGRSIVALVALMLAAASAAHEPGTEPVSMRVEAVTAGGAAEAAGLRQGDLFLKFDGKDMRTIDDLRSVLAAHRPGDVVPLGIEREGQPMDLSVTLGATDSGGASIGVQLIVTTTTAGPGGAPTGAATECRAWLEKTYGIDAVTQDLGLDLAADWAAARACVERDMAAMPLDKAIPWCPNVFKVHCAGIELLGEIGDALVARCKGLLEQSHGASLASNPAWSTCAQHEIYDRYVKDGASADAAACKAAWTKCTEGSAASTR